jgi:hypothetical protein
MENCEPVKKWNSAVEEADRLGVKPSWVWSKARSGKIPCSKVGKYYFFDPRQTDEWLKKQGKQTQAV